MSEFYCYRHRREGDVPLAGEVLFRRVSITLEAVFAASSSVPMVAKIEALARLDRAVKGAGGFVNLHAVTTVVGRGRPPPAPGEGRGESGKG